MTVQYVITVTDSDFNRQLIERLGCPPEKALFDQLKPILINDPDIKVTTKIDLPSVSSP